MVLMSDAQHQRSSIRVLLVEDDEDDFLLTRDLFREMGEGSFALDRIATYDAALPAIREQAHDVYLLDYGLGSRTGLELLREAFGGRVPHGISVILLTGLNDRELDVQAMEAGAANYLIKAEVTSASLERAIRYALGSTQPPSATDNPAKAPPVHTQVLLVEDDEDDYLLTRDLLSEIGEEQYILHWVTGYEAAIDAVATQRYDVCLLDRRLGRHDGVQLLREHYLDGMPVIMLTGQDDRDVDLQALQAGAVDYLLKGRINAAMLERSIRYAIQRKRSEEMLAELERRVQERTAELQEADRQKDQFLAAIAHELRNPLAAITSALNLMLMAETPDPDIEEGRDIISRQAAHIQRLVDDLMDVARIIRGGISLHSETLDAFTIMDHAVEMARPSIDQRRHQLTVTRPETGVRLRGDLTRLAQVVSNLLTNAARYTPEEGEISLTAQATEEEVLFRVHDNGIGIAPETLSSVFHLFARASNSNSEGLGVGLTVVQNLVELHGGKVEAYSDGLGKGSEFIVRLPRLQETGQLE